MGTRPIPTRFAPNRGGSLPPGPFVGRIVLLPRVLVRGSIRLNVETLRLSPSRGQETGEIGLFIRTVGVCSLPMLFLLSGWAQGPSIQGLALYGGEGHPCHGDFRSDLINQFYSSHGNTYMISISFEPKGFHTVRDFFIKHALNMLW